MQQGEKRPRASYVNQERSADMVKNLTKELFDRHPVWKWDKTNEGHCPVENPETLPEGDPSLFFRAIFKTSDGETFNGYVIGRESFYAFGLFVEGKEIVLNLNLPEFIQEEIQEICALLGRQNLQLFPLHFQTQFRVDEKHEIQGTLSP